MSCIKGSSGPARSGFKWFLSQLCSDDMDGARCPDRPELPWTADCQPDRMTMLRMQETCAGCPVRGRCASIGVDALGGMYAGVWLPWKDEKGSPGVRTARQRLRERVAALSDARVLAAVSQ